MCAMTHLCVSWLDIMCVSHDSFGAWEWSLGVQHGSFTCVTWLMYVTNSYMVCLHVCHDSFMRIRWLIRCSRIVSRCVLCSCTGAWIVRRDQSCHYCVLIGGSFVERDLQKKIVGRCVACTFACVYHNSSMILIYCIMISGSFAERDLQYKLCVGVRYAHLHVFITTRPWSFCIV